MAFERMRPFAVCSATRMCGYCVLIGAQKNGLRRLPAGLERAGTTGECARFTICRAQDFGLFWNSRCGASRAGVAAR